MKKCLRRFGVLSVLVFLTGIGAAMPASAQEAGQMDIGFGYQFFHISETSVPVGFNVDVTGAINDQLSVVGEVGLSRKSEEEFGISATTTLINFGGGVRWSSRSDMRFTPFAQVIVGAERDSFDVEGFENFSETNFILQPGGGIIVPLNDTWDVFGQFDIRRVFYEFEGETGFRFVAGARVGLP